MAYSWKKGENLRWRGNQANELQRKKPRSKKFELVIFGDSITKRIDQSFIARCEKSLALNYAVGGAKVWGVYEQMWTFRENHQEAAVTNVIIHVGTNHLPRDHPSDNNENKYTTTCNERISKYIDLLFCNLT